MLTLPKIILNFGGHSGEVITILDKFIHLWGTLEKKWSQQALIIKHKEKIIFPPRQLLVTRTIPADTPHSLQSLLMAPWEDQQKLAKDMNFFKSQLSQISICGAWLRQEGKNSRCPFLYKFRLAGRKKKNWLLILFLPGIATAFLFVLFCVLRNLTWQSSDCPPTPKYGQIEM